MTPPPSDIPFIDLSRQIDGLRLQLDAAMGRVIELGDFVRGAPCSRFEEAFARYLGVRHVVALASGTDALALSMAALGIGPGHEVIVPANTFAATAEAVLMAGATPVFADVDRDTLNLDVEDAEDRLTPQTRAVVPVHLHGNPADMAGVLELASHNNLRVIEDAAQA
ncbi:MAG: aminotransferase class I/II-fold pyridoxal phosphate-dependent enzyme, partial [Myxococcota bacterium]|nr:aminotransferase class I/II-fold pyridoxal phosphate-dependent enzyme [Myxococcota bacterium]